MEKLSAELLYAVAALLSPRSLAAFQCTSKRCYVAFASNYFWKHYALKILPVTFSVEDCEETLAVSLYPPGPRRYKALLARYERIERNWTTGIFSGALLPCAWARFPLPLGMSMHRPRSSAEIL